MKTAGIVAEYNPFHLGHQYQIEQTKAETGADFVVVILSGSFVQRGEAALFDKWTRTQAALLGGADLVLELPVLFALSAAPSFAFGAVQSLIDSGIVDVLSFGVENATEKMLKKTADFLLAEPPAFSAQIKALLDDGMAYPAAFVSAMETFLPDCSSLAKTPNNILALEYAKTVQKKQPSLPLFCLKRQGEGYHSPTINAPFPSASALRTACRKGDLSALLSGVPSALHELYTSAWEKQGGPTNTGALFLPLQSALRQQTPEQFREILEVEEGLEHRIFRLFPTATDWESLLLALQSRRYSRPRLQRALLHGLLSLTTEELHQLQSAGGAPYLRVLGYRKEAACLVKKLHQTSRLPVVMNVKESLLTLPLPAAHLLRQECFATELFSLCCPNAAARESQKDWTTPILRL